MWGNPTNGHLISSSSQGLIDIDPIAGSFRVINAGVNPDGVTVSPDGTVAYVEAGGAIQSYNIATGALLRTFATGHSPDGTGVISGGLFNGDVIVNNNDGTVGFAGSHQAGWRSESVRDHRHWGHPRRFRFTRPHERHAIPLAK